MELQQTLVIPRADLFKLLRKQLKELGYDVCNLTESIDYDEHKLVSIQVQLSHQEKDLKI
jgi:hypothetical protein